MAAAGSVLSRQGVPLVILPIPGDQPYCAKRCESLGVARVIRPAERHPEAIRMAVRAVLGDPAYRARARRMRDEIHALPPVTTAISALERLVHEHADGMTRSVHRGQRACPIVNQRRAG